MKRKNFIYSIIILILCLFFTEHIDAQQIDIGTQIPLGLEISHDSFQVVKDTILVVAKDEQDNALFVDIVQVTDGKITLEEIIEGATLTRRMVLLVSMVLIFILVARLFITIFFKRQEHTRLRLFALITLVSGWAWYYVGFFFGGTATSFIAFFVRPLLASLGMFVGNTSYQELSTDCVNSTLYMTVFSIIHFAAILVSAIFVINVFWKRSKSLFQIKIWSMFHYNTPLNVFFGLNEQNVLLAQDIENAKKKGHILFIDLPTEDEKQKGEMALSQLLGFTSYNQDYLKLLSGVRYALKSAGGKLSNVDGENRNILATINLHCVRTLIKRHHQTRFFFLSDNETENVMSVLTLIQDMVCQNNIIDIYCHARKNKKNSVIEKMAYLKGGSGQLNVHIVDTSSLAIQLLKRQVDYQPVSFVSPNTQVATVDNPFTALVVGFGETGRDAVRFLYEFGAFVNSEGQKSQFKCYAIDHQMNLLKSDFYNGAPALKDNPEIELCQMSAHTMRFWEWVETVMPDLNYIVLTLGNDQANMQMAVDLFELACKMRFSNLSNFKIYIRSCSRDNEKQIETLINFYNEKCGATNTNGKRLKDILVVFGKSSELFTYDNIIYDETIANAKLF